MRKLPLTILLSAVSLGAWASPPTGGVATEVRNLPAFSSIALNGIGLVRVHRGSQALAITIDADLADRFETKVVGGKLSLGLKCDPRTLWLSRKLKTCEIDLSLPALEGIELNGAGIIVVDEFPFNELGLKLTGAGSVELRGSAFAVRVSCTGACRLLARSLRVGKAQVSITGAASVELGVRELLDVSISGSGSVLYWGDPLVSRRISGSGGLRRAGD
jgi:hypothetical protein